MPDDTNDVQPNERADAHEGDGAGGTSESTDYKSLYEQTKAEAEEYKTKYDSLDKSHRAVQRELEKARTQAGRVDSLANDLGELKTVVELLADSNLDEDARARIDAQRSEKQKRTEYDKTLSQYEQRALKYLNDAGVSSEEDPRYQDVLEAWNDGDYQGAIALARQYKSDARRKSKEEPDSVPDQKSDDKDMEAKIQAEVEKRLRAAGIRSVDDGSGAGAGSKPKFTRDNLGEQLEKMSREEILKHAREISEAYNG